MADYSESVSDGVTLDILTGDQFKVVVNRKGAEMISLAARDSSAIGRASSTAMGRPQSPRVAGPIMPP